MFIFPFIGNTETEKEKQIRKRQQYLKRRTTASKLQKEHALKLLAKSGPCSCGSTEFVFQTTLISLNFHDDSYHYPACSFRCKKCNQVRIFQDDVFTPHYK